MGKEKLTKEKFEKLLLQSGLSKEEFAELVGANKRTVQNWGTKNIDPPYWVESWLENYIAAKASKIDKLLAPINDWAEEYKLLLANGKADDMQVVFRRGSDLVWHDARAASYSYYGFITDRGNIIKTFNPGVRLYVFMSKEVVEGTGVSSPIDVITENGEIAEEVGYDPVESPPAYDTPDAK